MKWTDGRQGAQQILRYQITACDCFRAIDHSLGASAEDPTVGYAVSGCLTKVTACTRISNFMKHPLRSTARIEYGSCGEPGLSVYLPDRVAPDCPRMALE